MSFLDPDSKGPYSPHGPYAKLASQDLSYKGKAHVDESVSEYTVPSFDSIYADDRPRSNGIWGWLTFRKYRDGLHHERTKSVLETGFSSALWKFCLLHLPAMAATGGLLSLYILEVRWSPPYPTSEQLVALLFAAKMHEILIIMSLTDILLHRIRYGLLTHGGMPLGFISSAFRLSSPLEYLFSWEFWGTVGKPTTTLTFHSLTVAIILILSLVSFSASPLSAAAMMPRKYWFEFDQMKQPLAYYEYVTGNPYEMQLDSQHSLRAFTGDCLGGPQCEEQFLGPFYSAVSECFQNLGSNMDQTNISITSRGSPSRYRPLSVSASSSNYSSYDVALATGAPYFVAQNVGKVSSILSSMYSYDGWRNVEFSTASYPIGSSAVPGEKWKQPLVAVDCQPGRAANDPTFNFNSTIYNIDDLKLDAETIRSRLSTQDDDTQSLAGNPMFLEMSKETPYPVSASILYSSLASEGKSSDIDFTLCLVHARWVESEIWAPSIPPAAVFNLPAPRDKLLEYLQQTSTTENVIKLKDTWMTGIGFSEGQANSAKSAKSPVWNDAYSSFFQFCQLQKSTNGTPMSLDQCLPIGLSLYLADALTSLTPYKPLLTDSPITLEEAKSKLASNDTIIGYKSLVHVYAYRLDNGLSVKLAFGLLFLYVYIALLHNLILFFSPNRWLSSAWGSLGELMALALRSKVPIGLENVGGGVTSSGTWSKSIQVRDVSGGRLEMVMTSSRAGDMAIPGHFTEGDDARGPSSDVKANVEYS